MKPITPYNRLLEEIKDFCRKLKYRRTIGMFTYRNARTGSGGNTYSLIDLYERTAAAQQLGYEVVLVADNDTGNLRAEYREKVKTPYRWEN